MLLEPARLEKLIETSLKEATPFVLYKSPKQAVFEAMFQNDAVLLKDSNFDSGFCMGYYASSKSPVYLRADQQFTVHLPEDDKQANEATLAPEQQAKSVHLDLVKKAVETIKSSALEKVVLARALPCQLSAFDPMATFYKMCQTYKNAFVYWFFHPKVGQWMGATPELLLNVWSDGKFETMSLAGTVAHESLWTAKEKKEQEVVTHFIENQVKPLSNQLVVLPVETIKAGKLFHLRSKLVGYLSEGKTVDDLIAVLHPTPAVGGFPKQEALTFIAENEGFDRSFYTGYLGPIHTGQPQSFYVNLRCMQVLDEENVVLYVGGGVNTWSDPQKEWEETVLKSRTILDVLV